MPAALPDPLYPSHLAEWVRRADHALDGSGYEALAIGAGTAPMQFRDDQAYPFVAAPYFRAFAPLTNAPGSCVIHRPGHRPELVFVQPEDYWHQPPAMPDGAWLEAFDVTLVRSAADVAPRLPARAALIGPEADWPAERRAEANPAAVVARLDYARAVKTGYEIACAREASRLAVAGHRAAVEAWRAGATEFEVHLAYLRGAVHEESELPYANIIAMNEASAVLHYTLRRRRPALPRRSLLVDAGAQFRGYAADITRSYAVGPCAYADLIHGLDTVQQWLCAQVVPGRSYVDLHLAAHRGVADVLRTAGLISASPESAVESGLTSVFFPHGVGHLLGLQVHDAGGLQTDEAGTLGTRPAGHPYLRLIRTIEEGFVVTIEPGIYFIPMLLNAARSGPLAREIHWESVDRLVPFGGIRIEDNVAATAAGPENLTRNAFAATP